MPIVKNTLLALAGGIGFLYLSLMPEIHAMPTVNETVSHLFSFSPYISIILFFTLIIIVPILIVVFILSTFKKFVFNHSKSVYSSFNNALVTIAISHLLGVALVMISFLIDLAFKPTDYYFQIRFSYLFSDKGAPHTLTINILMTLMAQSTVFMIAFLITEIGLTYKYKVISSSFSNFVLKNIHLAIAVFLIFAVNVKVMNDIEINFEDAFRDRDYSRNFGTFDKLAESVLLVIMLMYGYSLFIIYDS